jgi:hypothetical protein
MGSCKFYCLSYRTHVDTKSSSGNFFSYSRGYDNMKIETKMRYWVAASGIFQQASVAAESLSRVRAAPPSLRQTLPYAVRRTAGKTGKEAADSHVLCAAKDETSVDIMRRIFCCNFLLKSRL